MKTFPLDEDGDIDISYGTIKLKDGDEALAQLIRTRLLRFRGEYFLDRSKGLPYNEFVFQHAPDLAAFEAVVAIEIADTPGVVAVRDVSVLRDSQDPRRLLVTAVAISESAAIPLEVPLNAVV